MLSQQLGSAAWAGVAAMVVVLPLCGIVMFKFSVHNTARLEVADKRVELISECLNGIRMIKAFA